MADEPRYIRIEGARQHNLKNLSVRIPRDRLVVLTGLSGSGKSSLAFDTIHAEGRRMYMETLSVYARQFLEQMAKPDIDHIEGLPATIAIEQRGGGGGPRSTVATTTEVYDYLRLLFARAGDPHCWVCARPIARSTPSQIVDAVLAWPAGTRIMVLAPLVRGQRGEHAEALRQVQREGFVRARIDGELTELREAAGLKKARRHDIEVVVDRLVLKPEIASRLADSIALALRIGAELAIVTRETARDAWEDHLFSTRYACPDHPEASLPELSPRLFSFNSPHGACPTCDGLGNVLEFDADLVVPDPSRSLVGGAIEAWRHSGRRLNANYRDLVDAFCAGFGVSPEIPFRNIPAELQEIILHGTSTESEQRHGSRFEGVLPNLKRVWASSKSESLKQRLHTYLAERPCEVCGGARLNPQALSVRVAGRNLHELTAMTIEQSHAFLSCVAFAGERAAIAGPILREIVQRLRFMVDVGVGYLSLDRSSGTLSGGEAQRTRLATQVGSALVGACYVLDEPTIGLHQRDSGRLIETLRKLRAAGNTVLVVEHDEDTIRAAEHIIDMGPGAGAAGGRIIAQGTLDEIIANPESITGRYLRGEAGVPLPEQRRAMNLRNAIEVVGAAEHNLKTINVRFPLNGFLCVTGVSGSGKSSLVNEVLLKAMRRRLGESRQRPGKHERIIGASRVDRIVQVDQAPIGRTPRSNPATYTGLFDLVRKLLASTREAKVRGYGASRFSFNVKGGRCEACQGQGTRRIEMHFLPDVYVVCDVCKGTRYERETLEVRYRGKNVADLLAMRVEEAMSFFSSFDNIRQILLALDSVGLGYITLGQASTTLSGGEAQRVKLAAELARSTGAHTLYVLDEPTTGLHFADVENLLGVLNRLVDKGHTMLVIEHNLEVIKIADWVIDLGPEGGDAGGRGGAYGPPETIAACPESHTGRYLRERLERSSAAPHR